MESSNTPKRRIWTAKQKAEILDELDRPNAVAREIAARYQISPVQLSQWRNQRNTRRTQRSFRLGDEINRRLNEAAKAKGCDITALIEDILTKYFQWDLAHETAIAALSKTQLFRSISSNDRIVLQRLFAALRKPLLSAPQSLPEQLISGAAYDAILSMWRAPMDFIDSWNKDRTYIEYSYTKLQHGPSDFDAIADFQKYITTNVALFGEIAPLKIVPHVREKGRTPFYDIVSRPDIFTPRILCFGEYLTNRRRSEYGIIPYGTYERFCVLMHEDTWKIFSRENEQIAANIDDIAKQDRDIVTSFFAKLTGFDFEKPRGSKSAKPASDAHFRQKIYALAGFINDEIVKDVIYGQCGLVVSEKFRLSLEVIDPPMDEFWSWIAKRIKHNRHSFIIADLLCAGDIDLHKDIKLIPIRHCLSPIPVGIGFTLTALPKMLMNEEHAKLVRSLKDYFRDASRLGALKEDFRRSGVELTTDMYIDNS